MDATTGDVIKITGASGTVSHFVVLACDDGIATGLVLTKRSSNWAISIVCGELMYADPRRLCWKNLFSSDFELVRTLTEDELERCREAVAKALGIGMIRDETHAEPLPHEETAAIMDETIEAAGEQAKALIRAQERAEVYKGLYEDLLAKVMRKRRDG